MKDEHSIYEKFADVHKMGELKAFEAIREYFPKRQKGYDVVLYTIYRQGMGKGADLLIDIITNKNSLLVDKETIKNLYIQQCENDTKDYLQGSLLPHVYKTKKLEQFKAFYISSLYDGILQIYEACKLFKGESK